MSILALDIGSSSVKAALVGNGKIRSSVIRQCYPSHFDGVRAEIEPTVILKAIVTAIHQLGSQVRKVDFIALSVLSPAWLAMDRRGKPLTPLVTHQDRRSIDVAHELESKIGKAKLLSIAGNRPFPGGISSTTAAWFLQHQPSLMKRANLVGHLNTFIHRQLTGQRVVDPSNASFMGIYETAKQGTWSPELCTAVRIRLDQLPEIFASNAIAGHVLANNQWGLTSGTPVLAGMVDTSAAMILAGPTNGQMVNVSGSTDVLALCTHKAHPHERLLTRALGVGKKWLSVATLAAGGSSLMWMHDQFFSELSMEKFNHLLAKLARQPAERTVQFAPYLAGDRMSIDQRTAAFSGLNLSTTREIMLSAVIESLAEASGARLPLLKQCSPHIKPRVLLSGGVDKHVAKIIHRNWPGRWRFHSENEAMLRGLSLLIPE
jgi:sugar (pentulose or hexulose) kinase